MTFYNNCLGGELVLQTVGDSPVSGRLPASMKDRVLHCTLKKGKLLLMASDMVGDQGLVKGNSVSLMLYCGSEQEIFSYYEKLSAGGVATHPVEPGYWGALFGDLTDRYGNQWLLHFDKNNRR